MKILSIETSCDETGAAVLEKEDNKVRVISSVIASSAEFHAITGGIIPEQAARLQVQTIIPVIRHALLLSEGQKYENPNKDSVRAKKILEEKIDAIAVTHGPGLIGSLLVGVETAKTLSYVFNKPLIPVHHLLAHIFANFISPIEQNASPFLSPPFPFIGLIVSGGHTDLLYFKSVKQFEWLGGTRDDAAGEALDKIGRVLGLSYPAGPEIEERAKKITKPYIQFKSPLMNYDDFDFSFSGLKTEVMRFIQNQTGDAKRRNPLKEEVINQICYATQKAIIDVLVKKTLAAAEKFNCQTIVLGGGVSANQTLRQEFERQAKSDARNFKIFAPEKIYCTDNAAMIGAYALMNFKPVKWQEIKALPELYFE